MLLISKRKRLERILNFHYLSWF